MLDCTPRRRRTGGREGGRCVPNRRTIDARGPMKYVLAASAQAAVRPRIICARARVLPRRRRAGSEGDGGVINYYVDGCVRRARNTECERGYRAASASDKQHMVWQ